MIETKLGPGLGSGAETISEQQGSSRQAVGTSLTAGLIDLVERNAQLHVDLERVAHRLAVLTADIEATRRRIDALEGPGDRGRWGSR